MPSDRASDRMPSPRADGAACRPASPRTRRGLRLVGAGALAGLLAVSTAAAASAGTGRPDDRSVAEVPGGAAAQVSLAGWDLILPVGASGESSGNHARILRPAALRSPYLTRESDGSLNFWAPSVGATTMTSAHPRTELVGRFGWTVGRAKHTLSATLSVGQVPGSSRDVIIGQIHGAGEDSAIPVAMLHYDGGDIRVTVKQDADHATVYRLLGGVPLGTAFGYTLSDNGDGTLTFTARTGSGGAVRRTVPVPSAYRNLAVRFSAGGYEQATEALPYGDGARVVFTRLSAS
ncbi:polysaccharide lyase family 7 protein [Kitasatospora sp. GP82]|uniref:polysaccharide lyase family 7 protein n=1 Tax=Kitasatospora sp. GP82 TaxID=3035089 RepID=UPI0024754190|nr:polysaccharide lyase family 7 protein [Kitasatospora sp. GP82]MDH6126471.1 hypothetical protein [Kitasatospora sp. GP82]